MQARMTEKHGEGEARQGGARADGGVCVEARWMPMGIEINKRSAVQGRIRISAVDAV